jgi:hypothetical protein
MLNLLKAVGLVAAGMLGMAVLADSAAAQALPSPFVAGDGLLRDGVAGNRAIPGYAAPGVALGGLVLRPELAVRGAVDSNVLNLSTRAEGDTVLLVEPRLRLEATPGRHRFGLVADARVARFADLENENSESFGVAANAMLEASPAAGLYASLRAGRRLEPRGSGGDNIPAAGPPLYDETAAAIGVPLGAGRVRLLLAGSWAERRYRDLRTPGPDIDQSFRDQRSWQVAPRAELRLTPAFALFAGGSYTDSKSLEPLGILARDSTGVVVSGGVAGDLTPLLTGEIEAGWRTRNYKSEQFTDFDGAILQARLDWYPTELTSFALRAGQDFENSGIIGVPGILARRLDLDIFHELRRNLLLGGRMSYRHDRFRELGSSARTLEAALRAEWRLSPWWAVAGRFGWRDRSVSDSDSLAGFSGVQASIGLEARL